MQNMCHLGFMKCINEFHKKFKFSKENSGDKLIITVSGSKQDVDKLDKKIDALHVLAEGCCDWEEGGCC